MKFENFIDKNVVIKYFNDGKLEVTTGILNEDTKNKQVIIINKDTYVRVPFTDVRKIFIKK